MRGSDDLTGILNTAVICAVIFVNGATDAPNSISGAVASGAVRYRIACILCAVFNFLGLAVSYVLFPSVAETVSELSPNGSFVPLLTVVIFASAAWAIGVPTSESHALLAAMAGVSLYRFGVSDAKIVDICVKSFVSCAAGFGAGGIFTALTHSLFSKRAGFMRKCQIISAVLSSASHGMQDGQKFICLLAPAAMGARLPMRAVLICAAVMAAGCLMGGRRITDTVGSGIVTADTATLNASSDVGAVVCSIASSFLGIPVSTTYMKTCALLGSAAVRRVPVSKNVTVRFFCTWVLTYPICMGIAYLLCAVSGRIF